MNRASFRKPGTEYPASDLTRRTDKASCCATILALLAIGAAVAAGMGFISPDSWGYLTVAQSLRNWQGCSVGGQYAGAQPCGYPLAIALTAPSVGGLPGLVMAGKFTNFLLLAGGFLLVAGQFENLLVPTVLFVNPITIELYRYTWSENLLFFAFCGSTYAILQIHYYEASYRRCAVLLGFFLIAGCASRYFFGPFAVVIFVATWFTYGRKTAFRSLPAFVAAGLFFVAYLGLNLKITGYGTGMVRLPTPETHFYLTVRFFEAIAKDFLFLGVGLLAIKIFQLKRWTFSFDLASLGAKAKPYLFLAWSGFGFLILAYWLRVRVHFDMFNARTIGYGEVLLTGAFVGLFTRLEARRYPVVAVAFCGLLSTFAGQSNDFPRQLKRTFKAGYESPLEAIRAYHGPATDAKVIITLAVPNISETIAGNPRLYYGPQPGIVYIAGGLDNIRETPEALKQSLTGRSSSCVIDFTPFASDKDFAAYANISDTVDLKYRSLFKSPQRVAIERLDPGTKALLWKVFQPHALVPCQNLF